MDTHVDQENPAFRREALRRVPPSRAALYRRLAIMAALLLLVFGGLFGFERFREHMTAKFFATMKPPPVVVPVQPVSVGSLPRYLAGIGSLTAVHQVTVAPELAGQVTQIFFQPGAAVHVGDPLVQLNDAPEQGDLANFRAQARLADINLRRAKELAAHQNGPVANVDAMQSQLDQANASIAKTQAQIAQRLVRAPFSGVLGVRQTDLGQYLAAGAPLVTLTDLDTLYVNFTLPEQNAATPALGQTVEIAVDAYPGRAFTGKLTAIEPQISADTRNIKLQATLDNPGHILLPGMFANARIVLPPTPDVVTVPATAIDYSMYGDSVFVVTEGDKSAGDGGAPQDKAAGAAPNAAKPALIAKRVLVKTGAHLGDGVAVLSGLKPGDRVVTAGQLRLVDGGLVEPSDTGLTSPATLPNN